MLNDLNGTKTAALVAQGKGELKVEKGGVGTGVRSQVTGEGVAAPAGVAAEGAFEGLLAGVQFDVSQQVSLLGE